MNTNEKRCREAWAQADGLKALSEAGKICYRNLRFENNAEQILKHLQTFDEVLRSYFQVGYYSLSLYCRSCKESEAYCRNFVAESNELAGILITVYRPILERAFSHDLYALLGTQLILRLHSFRSLYSLELTESLQTEQLLSGAQQLNSLIRWGVGNDFKMPVEQQGNEDSVLLKRFFLLLQQRRKIASKLQLEDYAQLAFLRAERFDYDMPKLRSMLTEMRKLLVPYCSYLRRYRREEGSAQTGSGRAVLMSGFPFATVKSGSKLLRLFAEQVPDGRSFSSLIGQMQLHNKDWHEFFASFLHYCSNEDCIEACDDLPQRKEQLFLLPSDRSFLLLYDRRSWHPRRFISALGRAYGYMSIALKDRLLFAEYPNSDLSEAWAWGFYLLFLGGLQTDADAEMEADERKAEERPYSVQEYLYEAMEELCHYLLYQAVLCELELDLASVPLNETDVVVLEELWLDKLGDYYPDLAAYENFAEVNRRSFLYSEQLRAHPFLSVSKMQALLWSLKLWQRNDRDEARECYRDFCNSANSDSALNNMLKYYGDDPWDTATLKSIVYKLAYYMGH